MKKMLLVEDEEELIEIVETVMTEEGFEVRKALSAEEALVVCKEYIPDIIICDIKMGEMDGLTMLEELRNDPRLKDEPFIFLTGLDSFGTKEKAKKLGANAYITKPFDIDDLVATVRKLLTK
ncbi:MAG: response regulator [Bacteroidota bacterium]